MKKRTLLALVLAAALVFATACGGGSSSVAPANDAAADNTTATDDNAADEAGNEGGEADAPEDQITLTFYWWGNQVRNEITQQALDLYSEQNPHVTFDAQFAEWDDYWNRLATASAAHNMPDIVQMDYLYITQYVNNDLLVDLTPYVDNGSLDLSKVEAGILDSGMVDGKLYAVTNGTNSPSLLYNKTLLDEHNIEVKDYMTIDEFMDLSREIYEVTGYKTDFGYATNDTFLEFTMRGTGTELFGQTGGLALDDASQFEVYWSMWETGIQEGWHVGPEIFAERTIGSVEQAPIVYGSSPDSMSWCYLANSNQLAATQNAAPEGVDIGITTWPAVDFSKAGYLKPSQFFSVTTDSEYPEEAAKVLDFITNSVECNEILKGERGVPVNPDVADAIAPLMTEKEQEMIAYINDVVTPNCSPISPPSPDGTSEFFDMLHQLQEQVLYGLITSAEASETLFARGNEILG